MKKSQLFANLIDKLEKEYGKNPITMHLRFQVSCFKGYEHYRPTKENFNEFFK